MKCPQQGLAWWPCFKSQQKQVELCEFKFSLGCMRLSQRNKESMCQNPSAVLEVVSKQFLCSNPVFNH